MDVLVPPPRPRPDGVSDRPLVASWAAAVHTGTQPVSMEQLPATGPTGWRRFQRPAIKTAGVLLVLFGIGLPRHRRTPSGTRPPRSRLSWTAAAAAKCVSASWARLNAQSPSTSSSRTRLLTKGRARCLLTSNKSSRILVVDVQETQATKGAAHRGSNGSGDSRPESLPAQVARGLARRPRAAAKGRKEQ